MNYLVISNGKVENIVVIENNSTWEPPSGTTLIKYDGAAGVGWNWTGTECVDPNPPAPDEEEV